MKKLLLILSIVGSFGASIVDLTPITNPSDASLVYVGDTNASPKDRSYVMTNLIKFADINTQVEFEAKLFILPSGGGVSGTTYINGSALTNANFSASTYLFFVVTSSNVTAYPTNLTSAHLATDSVSADELNATGVKSELEAVLVLSNLQGAVTDAQVPNNITIDLATLATTAVTAQTGDSATAFFPSGTIEVARLPSAIVYTDVNSQISAVTAKVTPVAADFLLIEDSAASNAKKSITISSMETALEALLEVADLQGSLAESRLSFTDITTGNATASNHGFLKKLSGNSGEFMNGAGNWAAGSADGTGNWTASGTTNSLLAGESRVYNSVITNSQTIGDGTTIATIIYPLGAMITNASTGVTITNDIMWLFRSNVTASATLNATTLQQGGVAVVTTARSLVAGVGLSGGGDLSADRTFTLDPTEVTGNRTWADGSDASIVWTFNLSAGDPGITFGNGVVNVNSGTLQQGGTAVVLTSRTVTVAGTSLGITSSAGAQDLSANRTWTLDLDRTATLAGNPALGANTVAFGTTGMIYEGSSADNFEGLLTWPITTSDKTITLPDATGTVVLQDSTDTLSSKTMDAGNNAFTSWPVEIGIACSDETTAVTAAANKATFRLPYGFTLTAVRASVTTAPTGATIIIDINEGGTTVLSTKLSIDATEKTSTTAASAAVISDATLADDAEITIDFDQVGSTIAGAGVKVWLIGTRTI